MKKKIGDLALREIREILSQHVDEENCENCPFYDMDCRVTCCEHSYPFADSLDEEIEIEDKDNG